MDSGSMDKKYPPHPKNALASWSEGPMRRQNRREISVNALREYLSKCGLMSLDENCRKNSERDLLGGNGSKISAMRSRHPPQRMGEGKWIKMDVEQLS